MGFTLMKNLVAFACALALWTPTIGRGGDLDPLMEEFFAAPDFKARLEIAERIIATRPDPLEVEKRLQAGRKYSKDVKTGWQILENACADGKKRPYHLYAPKDYDPARRYPVDVALHAGAALTWPVGWEPWQPRVYGDTRLELAERL